MRTPPVAAALLSAYLRPESALAFDTTLRNEVMRLAGRWQLLPRLAGRFNDAGLLDRFPEKSRTRLEAALALGRGYERGTLWELNRITRALHDIACPVVVLKGAAYIVAALPAGRGRTLSDIDILVPRDWLPAIERAVLAHGWEHLKADEYDEYYYRHWTHELPPLFHSARGSSLDVHHTILPPLGRLKPEPALLFAAARPVPDTLLSVLCPADMVLHSAAHLFQDGDLGGGVRDLTDLDILLRHFGANEPSFWGHLVPRAESLQLGRPLYYALRYTGRLLETPIPAAVLTAAERHRPGGIVERIMDALVYRALLPPDVDSFHWDMELAHTALLARGHWLKMPLPILARHLTHQLNRRWRAKKKKIERR